jgi:hypothetical protein
MLVVTDEGAIVADGHYCDRGHVPWLKSEFESRFGVPVKFVVLSHDHQSHICETEVSLAGWVSHAAWTVCCLV